MTKDPKRVVPILKKEWFETKSIDGKLIALGVLGTCQDTELIKNELIPFNFNKSPPNNSVPAADMHALGSALANNRLARNVHYEFLKSNYDACIDKLGNPIVVDRYIKVTLGRFTDVSAVDDLDAFFKDKDTEAFNRTFGVVKDTIRGRAAYKERDLAALKEWFKAHGYL